MPVWGICDTNRVPGNQDAVQVFQPPSALKLSYARFTLMYPLFWSETSKNIVSIRAEADVFAGGASGCCDRGRDSPQASLVCSSCLQSRLKPWKTTIDASLEGFRFRWIDERHQIPHLIGSSIISVIVQAEPPKSPSVPWYDLASRLFLKAAQEEEPLQQPQPQPQSRRVFFIRDSAGNLRKLPTVHLFPGSLRLAFFFGIICAWTVPDERFWRREHDQIFLLNIGRGEWKWRSFPVEYVSNWNRFVHHNGVIYAVHTIASYRDKGEAEEGDEVLFCGHNFSMGLPLRPNISSRRWYETEPATYKAFKQTYDLRYADTSTKSVWVFHPCMMCPAVSESWAGVGAPMKLAGFTDKFKCLVTHAGGTGWRLEKSVPLPEDGWYDLHGCQLPAFLRGECFVPPLNHGYNIVFFWKVLIGSGSYSLKVCNTSGPAPVRWRRLDRIDRGLVRAGLLVRRIWAADGRLCAVCSDGNRNGWERKCFIFHGMIDLKRGVVRWDVFVKLKAQVLECWEPMKLPTGYKP